MLNKIFKPTLSLLVTCQLLAISCLIANDQSRLVEVSLSPAPMVFTGLSLSWQEY